MRSAGTPAISYVALTIGMDALSNFVQHGPGDGILELSNSVLTDDESDCELEPVVGEPLEDPRRQVVHAEEMALLNHAADS